MIKLTKEQKEQSIKDFNRIVNQKHLRTRLKVGDIIRPRNNDIYFKVLSVYPFCFRPTNGYNFDTIKVDF